jgi:hypothetical protein
MGKRNGKRKKKRDFLATGPGGISAQPSAGLPAGDDAMGAGPRVRGRRGVTAAGEVPRRFFAGDPVLRRRNGGKA